jgi:hypothetical protein
MQTHPKYSYYTDAEIFDFDDYWPMNCERTENDWKYFSSSYDEEENKIIEKQIEENKLTIKNLEITKQNLEKNIELAKTEFNSINELVEKNKLLEQENKMLKEEIKMLKIEL